MPLVTVIADDLSGAVETAATFLLRTTRISVALDARPPSHVDEPEIQVFDTDSRQRSALHAAGRASAAFAAVTGQSVVFKKIDSLLRGHLVPELLAARTVRPNLIVAPALPAIGRTVLGGVIHVNGRPLSETGLWHAESAPAPTDIGDALRPVETVTVPLATVRSAGLAGVLRARLASGTVPVCDADSDIDLDLIVAAAAGIEDLVLVGSAGLAGALARTVPLSRGGADPGSVEPAPAPGPLLIVVGSASHGIAGQLESLTAVGATLVLSTAAELLDPDGVVHLRTRLENARGEVVVAGLDPTSPVNQKESRKIVRRLALGVTHAAGSAAGLALTGGETARSVLDALGIRQLRPLFEVHHGAVVSAATTGQLIATRPGSFGDRDSLLSIVRALQQAHTPSKESA